MHVEVATCLCQKIFDAFRDEHRGRPIDGESFGDTSQADLDAGLVEKDRLRLLVANDVAVVDELAPFGDLLGARRVRVRVLIEAPEAVHHLEGDVEDAA
jgi:hypothetical protein